MIRVGVVICIPVSVSIELDGEARRNRFALWWVIAVAKVLPCIPDNVRPVTLNAECESISPRFAVIVLHSLGMSYSEGEFGAERSDIDHVRHEE